MEMKPINSLHYKYWIFILILIIIAIFSYYNSGDANLTSMIAFAATIASIILSVLAIFMSILSNNSIVGMLHKVRDMHDAVSGIPSSLEQSVSELKDASTGLTSINQDVTKSLSALGAKLQDLDEHISENNSKLQEYLDSRPSEGISKPQSSDTLTDSFVQQFLVGMSLNGLILIYAFYLYKEKGKKDPFSLPDFVDFLIGVEVSYLFGVMVASTCAQILFYVSTKDSGNKKFVNITLSHHITKIALENNIKDSCKNIREGSDIPEYYELEGLKKRINDYLATLN